MLLASAQILPVLSLAITGEVSFLEIMGSLAALQLPDGDSYLQPTSSAFIDATWVNILSPVRCDDRGPLAKICD
jgi:hypothetical protein